MRTRRSVRWWLGAVAACGILGCSENKSGLHVPNAGAGGQTKADAMAAGGAGGGTGGAATGGITGRGGAGGGAESDAPVAGGAGGNLTSDAAVGSGGRTGGTTGSGGTGGPGGGAGGTTRTGGAGGGSSCPMVPPCNWCGGANVYDSNGCVVDWRCANGVSPCTTSACGTSNPCAAGYACGTDRLCWPEGAGGVGGGAGGTAGRGGAGGVTGMGGAGGSGSTCPGIPSCNWCGGTSVTNNVGCIVGWRCANGADPCSTQPCPTSYTCPTGYTCTNQLCWPAGGAGGGGGTNRTGGAGGGGGSSGTGGTGGTTGTGQVGVRCLNALCNTGQVCCVSQSSSTPTLTCTSQAECAGDFAVTCDGPEDCGGAGHQCCMPSGAIMQTACATGNCLAGLAMCHSKADCAANESCCSVSTFGYTHGFCQTGTCTR
jgi:hypothetical protein